VLVFSIHFFINSIIFDIKAMSEIYIDSTFGDKDLFCTVNVE
jgi:hypothetical protein